MQPKSDGSGTGSGLTDVYIKQIGDQGIFGYAATDPEELDPQRLGYQVMDDDYACASSAIPTRSTR